MTEHPDSDAAVRIGLVGLGTIADIHADAREAFAAEHGTPTVDDRAAPFERVEAVLVTTPNRYHEEVAGTTRSEFGGSADYASIEGWGETSARDDREFGVDDSATAFVRCGDGRSVPLEIAWAANRPSSQTYHVRGTEGGGRLDLESGDLTVYETVPGDPVHDRTTTVDTPENDPIRAEDAAFLAGVRTGGYRRLEGRPDRTGPFRPRDARPRAWIPEGER